MNPREYSLVTQWFHILPRKEKLHMIGISAYRNSSFPELGKPGGEVIELKDRSLLKCAEFDANKIT